MYEQVEKSKENKRQSVTNAVSQKQSGGASTFQFVDNRSVKFKQHIMGDMTNNINRQRANQLQSTSNSIPQRHQELTLCAGKIIQRNVIKDVAKEKGVAIVGESHSRYLLPQGEGEMYRSAERKACNAYQLDYKVEYETIPIKLPDATSGKDSSARGNTTKEGIIRPDDTLLRLEMFAKPLLEKLKSSSYLLLTKLNAIDEFHAELQQWNEDVIDSLVAPETIKTLKSKENCAYDNCEKNHNEESVKQYITIPTIVEKEIIQSKDKQVETNALSLAKEKGQSESDDIVSATRSLVMHSTIAKWADCMSPTVYKVGGEHVSDIKLAMEKNLLVGGNSSKVRLVTEQEANGIFEEACPDAFKELNVFQENEKKKMPFSKPKPPAGRKKPGK